MDFKLELVLIPVSDVDRAKAFYVEKCGFTLDVDHQPNDLFRVVQMTPPGSACSITIGRGLTDASPGSYRGTHLVVTDIEAARAELHGRGVEVSDIRHMTPDGWKPGTDPQAQRLQLVRRLQGPRRQHLGPAGGQAGPVTDPAGGAGGGAGALINGAFSRTTSSTQAGVECALGVAGKSLAWLRWKWLKK